MALSFITSPRFPVSVNLPFPCVKEDSINKISPPTLVQASPVTTPATLLFAYLVRDRPAPKNLNKSSSVIFGVNFSSLAI